MVNIEIIFDRPDHNYSPGDKVNLQIHVQVNSNHTNTTYRSIYARLEGFANVQWHQNSGKWTGYRIYSNDESLFKDYQILAGQQGGSEMRLSLGSHVYQASFQLPLNLPANYENDFGHIKYEAKVHMEVSGGSDNKTTVPFFVIPRFDLNEFPHLREPIRDEANQTFGFCCWQSKPLHTYNILPRLGFVPGDRIQFNLEVNNESELKVNGAHVQLVEKIFYRVYKPQPETRESQRTLWEHNFREGVGHLVGAMENKTFSTDVYINPSWDFHFFNGCGIITVEYYFKSEASASGLHSNLSNYTQITIGTIPFVNSGAQFTNVYASPFEPISQQPYYTNAIMKIKPGIEPEG